jgi:hypothetical protein
MGSTVQLSEGASPQNHRRPGFGYSPFPGRRCQLKLSRLSDTTGGFERATSQTVFLRSTHVKRSLWRSQGFETFPHTWAVILALALALLVRADVFKKIPW